MEEIRKNHIVQLKTKDGTKLDGIVFDYEKDRVSVLIAYESLFLAKNLEELDEVYVSVNTHLGIKNMTSHVIDKLNSNNCVVIENNETIAVEQKREFVRVLSNMTFKLKKEDETKIDCYCLNISAGGVAFCANNCHFSDNETVEIIFPKDELEKEIVTNAQIIKNYDNYFVAKYTNLNPHDENKIVKYVFRLIAKK